MNFASQLTVTEMSLSRGEVFVNNAVKNSNFEFYYNFGKKQFTNVEPDNEELLRGSVSIR